MAVVPEVFALAAVIEMSNPLLLCSHRNQERNEASQS